MAKYLTNVLTAPVGQRDRLSEDQVKNNAGGYVYQLDNWSALNRFLILGSEGGTYYASEKKHTTQNLDTLKRCVKENPYRTITTIVEISEAGRAPKNDPALLALAFVAASSDANVRRAALAALPKVARIPTHLFNFLTYLDSIDNLSGRAIRTALSRWYNTKSVESVAYTVAKYRQRDGWTNGDVMSLAHIAPQDVIIDENGYVTKTYNPIREEVYRWVTKDGWKEIGADAPAEKALATLWAFEKAQRATKDSEVISLINEYNLSREMIPTEFLKSADVWDALLHAGNGMPMEAMIRNLGVMSSVGLLDTFSDASRFVIERLGNQDLLRKARIHPIKILAALLTYSQGHGMRGSNTWNTVTSIHDALDAAFYLCFGNVPSTGKNHLLALDVSGSMGMGTISGVPGLTPAMGSAAMALITANVEPNYMIAGFETGMKQYDISPKMRLQDVLKKISNRTFGGTDCALPFTWAQQNKYPIDAFFVYTDNETWAGMVHPSKALKDYRRAMNRPNACSAIIGMTATSFSIADSKDARMIDVVGFDTNTPSLMSEFVAGNL